MQLVRVLNLLCLLYLYCISVYPWGSLREKATVVDVGGGIGQACIKLYRSFPNLRFVIQNLPGPVAKGIKV